MKSNSLLSALFFCLFENFTFGQAFLQSPIQGTYKKDFIIVNYVDWAEVGIKDAYCGNKTYDGHQGTDFTIRSFKQMDSVIAVLASESGKVFMVVDGLFDKEFESDTTKGFGNYVGIKHSNGYFTYYAHLKKGSITVTKGQNVTAGQSIGKIGSSGNSSDPHLHFEVWYDSRTLVDPFKGNCGNTTSLWKTNEFDYDTSFGIWENGMYHNQMTLEKVKKRNFSIDCCPYVFPVTNVNPVGVWALAKGLRKGDELKANWYDPSNSVWFTSTTTLDQDWWFYYYWHYIDNKDLAKGNWKVELLRNNQLVLSQQFVVSDAANIAAVHNGFECKDLMNNTFNVESFTELSWGEAIRVFDFSGKEINYNGIENLNVLPKGAYLIAINIENQSSCKFKRIVY